MTLAEFEQLTSGLESLMTGGALIIGGLWAYQRFIRQREAYPHVEFSVDINFVGYQNGVWITELQARLENKGKVQHRIEEFQFHLSALNADDSITTSEEYDGQVLFPHTIAKGSWLPKGWRETMIDPGVETHYSFVTRVPEEATMALLHATFDYADGKESHSTEKTARVPPKPEEGT